MKFLKSHNDVTVYTQAYQGETLYTMIWSEGKTKQRPHIENIDYKIPVTHPVIWWVPYLLTHIEIRRWQGSRIYKAYRDHEFVASIYDAHIWEHIEPGYHDEILYNPKMAQKIFDPKIHLQDYLRYPKFSPLVLHRGVELPNLTTETLISNDRYHAGKDVMPDENRLSRTTAHKFIKDIVLRILDGESVAKIGADYGVSAARINKINSGIAYRKHLEALGYTEFPLRRVR